MSFFVARGGGRYDATEWTRGPWDPRHQHGGPPAALLAAELDRVGSPEMVFARLTFEILGAIPVGPVEVVAEVERPGRSVELVGGELRADGRAVMRARAWRVRPSPAEGPAGQPPLPVPAVGEPPPASFGEFGYAGAIEWRWARGGWLQPGAAEVWTRLKHPVVAGREPTPLQRILAVADSGNGVSAVLDWQSHLFINPELTVHLAAPPQGEWICLDAATTVHATGFGLAASRLFDRQRLVARGAQSLLVGPR
jgi:Thioesterase-like superfamily